MSDVKSNRKVAMVTGGASGIGMAIAKAFVSNGFQVVVVDINKINQKDTGNELKGVFFIEADLSKPENCKSIIEQTVKEFGRIDILVNNAGFQYISPIEDFPDDTSEKMFNLMLRTPFLLIKYSIPIMRKNGWGRIINISSIHGLVASPLKSVYVTVKHGLIGLTKATALESIQYGITCNAIAPTYADTKLVSDQIPIISKKLGIDKEKVVPDILMNDSPIKKLLDVDQITSVVSFLCLENASAINGIAIPIDYGYTAK